MARVLGDPAVIGLLREMFATPDAQSDAHAWAAVLLAHAALGAVMVALAACLPLLRRSPVLAVSLLYGLLWEGGQLMLAGGGPADGLLDWAAVTLGVLAGRAAWDRQGRRLAAALATVAAVLWAGVSGRRR